MRFRIIGQIKGIEIDGIKVITRKGSPILILKQTDPYTVNFDELNLKVGDKIEAIVGLGKTKTLPIQKENQIETPFDQINEEWKFVVAESLYKLSASRLAYLEAELKLLDALQAIYDNRYSQNPDPELKLLGFEEERKIRNLLHQLSKNYYKL